MTFSDIFVNYILPVLGTVITGLATWGTTVFVKWLNSKIKNRELAGLTTTIVNIAINAVKSTYQSYVEGLKGTDAWTKEAQEKALELALITAKAELTTKALDYIEEQHGDINTYLKTLFESIIYDLKNGSKKVAVSTEKK